MNQSEFLIKYNSKKSEIFLHTFPIRTTTGLREVVAQCPAVKTKNFDIIVPPQSKVILYWSFK